MNSQETTVQTRTREQLKQAVQNALNDDDTPQLYANGFVTGVGYSDAYLIVQTNGKPVAAINMSFSTLKTLALYITSIVDTVEKQLGQELLTNQQIWDRVNKQE